VLFNPWHAGFVELEYRMSFIKDEDKEFVQNIVNTIESDVSLIMFTQELECNYCRETRQLLEEISQFSDKIELRIFNFQIDKEEVQKYNIDKIPATVIEGKKDYGIRYYGIPSGYEFGSLLEDMVDVSRGETNLSAEQKKNIAQIDKPLHLQVFVTPTCPYCPATVRLAHKLAIENAYITADMVEATEFPHLAMRYNVSGVPRTVINEKIPIEGSVPEKVFVDKVIEAYKNNELIVKT
jgi:glutaredoxin-like protein